MKVLVSAASKHGSTTEIAANLGAALAAAGVDAVVMAPGEVQTLAGFDAAVLGSGIYVGRWLEPARDLVARHAEALRAMPVWLFSSGPVGIPPRPDEEPVDGSILRERVGAREHRVFPGLVEKKRLGLAEKAIMAAVRAQEGDYRPWPEIEGWARQIASELREAPAATPA